MSAPLTFASLWSNHPAVLGDESPCREADGQPSFPNQCAIRMGLALERAGVSLVSFRGARCWQRHAPPQRHVLRAQELADWLRAQRRTFGAVEIRDHRQEAPPPVSPTPQAPEEAPDPTPLVYRGRSGVVFLRDFWGAGNQGDHIDLWDGERMAHGDPGYFLRAEQVWFWPL